MSKRDSDILAYERSRKGKQDLYPFATYPVSERTFTTQRDTDDQAPHLHQNRVAARLLRTAVVALHNVVPIQALVAGGLGGASGSRRRGGRAALAPSSRPAAFFAVRQRATTRCWTETGTHIFDLSVSRYSPMRRVAAVVCETDRTCVLDAFALLADWGLCQAEPVPGLGLMTWFVAI